MPAYAPNDDTASPLPRGARPWKITGSVATDTKTALYHLRGCVRTVTESDRTRGCGHRAVRTEGPAVEVTHHADGAKAKWVGVLTCGHRWTCPVCAAKLMAKRRTQVCDALAAGRAAHPDRAWRMLTLTVRHRAGMALADLLRLRKAWRKTRQRGSVQRLWKTRVAASIRAIEVPDGKHGWHPHIHIAILTTEWTDDEALHVMRTWQEMVTRELGAACSPDDAHGMRISRDWKDSYLTKLGLETTGAAKENSAWGHAHAAGERYAVARRMLSRDERARIYEQGDRSRARFREYEKATKGCRAIELDDRATALARAGQETRIADGPADAKPKELVSSPSYEVDMTRIIETTLGAMSMMRALRLLESGGDRTVFAEALHVAARAPPYGADAALRGWLDERIAVRFTVWEPFTQSADESTTLAPSVLQATGSSSLTH